MSKIEQFLINNDKLIFSKSKISPGTQLMKKIVDNLKSSDFNNLLLKIKCKIIHISDYWEPDEAEIKLMRHIKHNIDIDKKYIVISPDADLILLC